MSVATCFSNYANREKAGRSTVGDRDSRSDVTYICQRVTSDTEKNKVGQTAQRVNENWYFLDRQ